VIAQAFSKYVYSYLLICHFALVIDRVIIASKNMSYIPPVFMIGSYIVIRFFGKPIARLIDPSFGRNTSKDKIKKN
jgi:hypothetical protein